MRFKYLAVVDLFLSFLAGGSLGDHVSINMESVRALVPPPISHLPSHVYKSYQGKIYCSASSKILYPSTIDEIKTIVKTALHTGTTVKAVGNRHSITDMICTEGIPINLRNMNQTTINSDGTVTVGAGAELSAVLQILHDHGRAIIHTQNFGGVTIGGAIATAAHGSTLLHPSSLSDQVVRLIIVDGLGKTRVIQEATELQAFRVHLGLLGVIVEVTLRTVPAFKMRVENSLESESILLDGTVLQWAKEYDSFALRWFPSSRHVVVLKGNHTDATTPGDAFTTLFTESSLLDIRARKQSVEILQLTRNTAGLFLLQDLAELSFYTDSTRTPPIYTEDGKTFANPGTGFAWRLMTSNCNECPWNHGPNSLNPYGVSMSVDMDEIPSVVNTIKNILEQSEATFPIVGIGMRFAGPSDALMAMNSGRYTAIIEWTSTMRNNPYESPDHGIAAYQAIQQAIVKEHGGRPHWGKNGLAFFSTEIIKSAYPNREAFIHFMNKYDPKMIFMNKFGRRLLMVSGDMDVDPNVTHCALQDYCFCKQNSDCANLQSCKLLNGYPVCNDPSGSMISLL